MSAAERNRRRYRSVLVARAWKELLIRGPIAAVLVRVAAWLWGRPAWAYRLVFAPHWRLRTAAHHVLADLRAFCFAKASAFDPDPLVMARRQGRRDVWLRISNYLQLDEEQVHKLMEIDDGI